MPTDLLITSNLLVLSSVAIGGFAIMWVDHLTDEFGLFDFIPKWFAKASPKIKKPLYECGYCCAGQMALWMYIIFWAVTGHYNVIEHFLLVSLSMVAVLILRRIQK